MRKTNLILGCIILMAALYGYAQKAQAPKVQMPMQKDSVKFAVIGDNGTGDKPEYQIADKLVAAHEQFPFNFVLMMGDNLYGNEGVNDFSKKFEKPYQGLLENGVKFYAALGNHDDPARQIAYEKFNMGGKHYYTFKPKEGVRFFALDSNYMNKKQLDWLENELKTSGSAWKVAYFQHQMYSSGETHGSNVELRGVLEPVMLKYGVDVVFTGHEHFYEHIKPQQGINYFIVGSSGKLREGNITKTELTQKGFDQDNTFLIAEIVGDTMSFQV